jgi:hypothetical protein
MTSQIQPLENSVSAENQYETELMALFMQLFDDNFGELAERIGFYGMPHLGDFSLVERSVTSDGLAVLRDNTEDSLRYLFKAWRYLNTQRGTDFLELYMRVLLGDIFTEINQLWQPKAQPYGVGLKNEQLIIDGGETLDDYFLTSRIEILVEQPVLTQRVITAIQTAIAARIVLDIRQAGFAGGGNLGDAGSWGTDSGLAMTGVVGGSAVNHYASAVMLPAPP